jgi:opacity protein-like surface antigen
MGTLKTLAVAGVMAVGFASSALSADMLFPPAVGMSSGGSPGIVELGTGWYLRGDAGYVDFFKTKEGREAFVDQNFERTSLEAAWSAGGGFGYKFVNWLRADVTVDHRFSADFEGRGSLPLFGTNSRLDRGRFESTTGLANAYLDLGNWYGFTPYVGAGVGAAMNRLSEYTTEVTCLTVGCGTIGTRSLTALDERKTYSLAWAVMGGVAVDVGGGFKVDVGYRYVNLGEARMRFAGTETATRAKEIEAHEVRLGLRYMIDQ